MKTKEQIQKYYADLLAMRKMRVEMGKPELDFDKGQIMILGWVLECELAVITTIKCLREIE